MRHTVTDADTATALGSGDVPVLATPRLIAWMEAATVYAVSGHLGDGRTSVGTAIRVEHLKATPVGGRVDVHARLLDPDADRRLSFEVTATDDDGELVGRGQVDRVVVDRDRFIAGLRRAQDTT